MQEGHKDNLYFTNSLPCAAALLTCGFKLSHIDSDENLKFRFAFVNNEYIGEAVESYFADTLSVSPKTYFFAVKSLKDYMFEKRRKQ